MQSEHAHAYTGNDARKVVIPDFDEFGRRVSVIRRRLGITGEELAHLARTSKSQIHGIERGIHSDGNARTGITYRLLVRVARALEVPPMVLVGVNTECPHPVLRWRHGAVPAVVECEVCGRAVAETRGY